MGFRITSPDCFEGHKDSCLWKAYDGKQELSSEEFWVLFAPASRVMRQVPGSHVAGQCFTYDTDKVMCTYGGREASTPMGNMAGSRCGRVYGCMHCYVWYVQMPKHVSMHQLMDVAAHVHIKVHLVILVRPIYLVPGWFVFSTWGALDYIRGRKSPEIYN